MALINFFNEDIEFTLEKPRKTAAWIKAIIKKEKSVLVSLNYVFCSDEFLLSINTSYLHHSSLTDIITFDHASNQVKGINGEIYISIPRVTENSIKFKTTFENELHRVMIHGVLHLLGFGDKTREQKSVMRKKEEACLSLF